MEPINHLDRLSATRDSLSPTTPPRSTTTTTTTLGGRISAAIRRIFTPSQAVAGNESVNLRSITPATVVNPLFQETPYVDILPPTPDQQANFLAMQALIRQEKESECISPIRKPNPIRPPQETTSVHESPEAASITSSDHSRFQKKSKPRVIFEQFNDLEETCIPLAKSDLVQAMKRSEEDETIKNERKKARTILTDLTDLTDYVDIDFE